MHIDFGTLVIWTAAGLVAWAIFVGMGIGAYELARIL
jgi:hypothetical protein